MQRGCRQVLIWRENKTVFFREVFGNETLSRKITQCWRKSFATRLAKWFYWAVKMNKNCVLRFIRIALVIRFSIYREDYRGWKQLQSLMLVHLVISNDSGGSTCGTGFKCRPWEFWSDHFGIWFQSLEQQCNCGGNISAINLSTFAASMPSGLSCRHARVHGKHQRRNCLERSDFIVTVVLADLAVSNVPILAHQGLRFKNPSCSNNDVLVGS